MQKRLNLTVDFGAFFQTPPIWINRKDEASVSAIESHHYAGQIR